MTEPRPPSDLSNEARLEAVLESVSDAFYAVDTEWRYVVFNRAAEQYFGVGRTAILGNVLWDLFPQGLGTPFETHCRAAPLTTHSAVGASSKAASRSRAASSCCPCASSLLASITNGTQFPGSPKTVGVRSPRKIFSRRTSLRIAAW